MATIDKPFSMIIAFTAEGPSVVVNAMRSVDGERAEPVSRTIGEDDGFYQSELENFIMRTISLYALAVPNITVER